MIGMFSFRLLKAVAAIVSLTIIIWSLGIPSINLVGAASITSVSNTLTDTDPGAVSDHTIVFTSPTGIVNGSLLTIDFSDGPFTGTSSITASDIDVADGGGDFTVAANCAATDEIGVSFTGAVLTVEFCPGDGASIAPNGTTTIEIGRNANPAGNQLVNPVVPDSYSILIGGTAADSGSTIVVILDNIEVTATVDTTFTFEVAGVGPGASVNGAITSGSSTATAIAFGALSPDVASTTAQEITVSTNASQGFVVTVEQSSEFISSGGAIIDSFRNGDYQATPVAWEGPTPVLGDLTTYGHWGLTTDDATTTRSSEFGSNEWVAASTTPVVIMSHDGPTDGTVTGAGTTRVGYQVEISSLQEASTDYQTTLTYIATPIF